MNATAAADTVDTDDFESLLAEQFSESQRLEGRVVTGTVVAVDGDAVTLDVGLKSEGRVSLREFQAPGTDEAEPAIGDTVDVFVERYEDRDGLVVLSRERAKREEAWTLLEKSYDSNERVNGVIFGRVKGGFTVDLSGAVAFLPGSQVDIRPVRDVGPLMGTPQPFQILKMDRVRGNIVVSRRAVLEETRSEARSELVANLKEGQVIEGVVKNITDYGAFVDLGGVDGLLHVTDIAWKRINHPSEALQIGQTVNVQIIRFNPENQRISLGMKQLETDPWDGVDLKYPVETKFLGRVTNITDYGAFVELEPGVEGLVHVSEISWTKKNIHPGKIVSTSQEVEVIVLDVDPNKRRISLGLKQCQENPWTALLETYPVGTEIEGEVKNITEFGLFVGLPNDIDGMVHMSDISWSVPGEQAMADYKRGDHVRAKILDVDVEKERISLGIKQLAEDPFTAGMATLRKGAVVTCTVTALTDGGIEVSVADGLNGFIRKSDLARDRAEQRPERFATGEKIDAKITQIDSKSRRLTLSIKAREVEDEKTAMARYGSSDSGASLGDILGAALAEKQGQSDAEEGKTKKAKAEAGDAKVSKAKTAKAKKTATEADDAPETEAKTAKAKKSTPKANESTEAEADADADAEAKAPKAKKTPAKKSKASEDKAEASAPKETKSKTSKAKKPAAKAAAAAETKEVTSDVGDEKATKAKAPKAKKTTAKTAGTADAKEAKASKEDDSSQAS